MKSALLIMGDSETCADLYYATRFLVSVHVMFLDVQGRKVLLVNDLEYGRAKAEAQVDEVVSLNPYEDKLRAAGEQVRQASVLDLYLREQGIGELTVTAGFPFANAERLRAMGYTVGFRDDPFFPERTVKQPDEIQAIEAAQRYAEEAMELAVTILRRSEIRGGSLFDGGAPLTAEGLRREVQRLLIDRGCQATNTIVAGGDQGADPHTRGTGPLPANQTIVLDFFPQSVATRYWGDMTRTVVRGKASSAVHKLYRDVRDAQELAFSLLRDGVDGRRVHEQVVGLFRERGNNNGEARGKKTGFIHGTGHGIGLELHEPPRVGRVQAKLAAGQVLTVEPGLYYPGIGAVRLEDVVVITADGCRNLNRFPKELEL